MRISPDQQSKGDVFSIATYMLASFFVLFSNSVAYNLGLLSVFLPLSYLLTKEAYTLKKVSKIVALVVGVYGAVTMLLSWQISLDTFAGTLPKGIALGILVSTGIVVFFDISTYQLARLVRVFVPTENASYALLAGMRTFPVLADISRKVSLAQKGRGVHRNWRLLVTTYLTNLTINFFEFIHDFETQLGVVDFSSIDRGLDVRSPRNLLFASYLAGSIGGVFYG